MNGKIIFKEHIAVEIYLVGNWKDPAILKLVDYCNTLGNTIGSEILSGIA